MNIKKNSLLMLGVVFGVSVILYIFDVPVLPSSPQITPTSALIPITPITSTSQSRTISEIGQYQAHQFNESIIVTLTLKNNIINDLKTVHSPQDGESALYHDAFDGEIRPLVIGKNIKDINVSCVAGASDTTNGFMQAIEKIKTQV